MKAAVLPVPVWAMPSRSRPSGRRDGLELDGRRLGIILGGERIEQGLGKPEFFESASCCSAI
jgi:hypothetical protein